MVIFILILFFLSVNCNEEFKDLICLFPNSFTLYNGNNLLCCSDGIYTYNSNFEETIYYYKFENQINSKEDAYLVSISQYPNNDNALLITKDKFYFISFDGRVLFSKVLALNNTGSYNTLIPYKYKNNYYFAVGFINSSKLLNIVYYIIDTLNKTIEMIKNYIPNVKNMLGNSASNFFNGFTCQIMHSNIYKDVLACFFHDNYPGEVGTFSFYINSTIQLIDDSFSYVKNSDTKRFIKSTVSPDKEKCLICFSCEGNYGYYLKYDINLLKFYSGPNL